MLCSLCVCSLNNLDNENAHREKRFGVDVSAPQRGITMMHQTNG
jgi:hypothetical protein